MAEWTHLRPVFQGNILLAWSDPLFKEEVYTLSLFLPILAKGFIYFST